MIDLKILRTNPDIVAKAIHDKAVKGLDLNHIITLDTTRTELKKRIDDIRAERNKLSDQMKHGKPDPALVKASRTLKESLSTLETEYEGIETEFLALYQRVPNIPTEDTPVGLTEDENVVVKQWGTHREFTFPIKNHAEIATARDWIDKDRAANVAGARFAYLKGSLVRLQFALINFVMDTLGDEEVLQKIIAENNLTVSSKPFTPVLPPALVKTAPYEASCRLGAENITYQLPNDDLWLNASAEHSLCTMYINEVLPEEILPIRYIGYSTSFRREAGTYGKDMEGIIRMHQFDKLEMESFTTAETGHDEHLLFSLLQEHLMQQLEIPYQKLQKCTYDIGKPNAKGSDIEAWLPGQQKYRETHTADYMTDYQARRPQTRIRRSSGEVELVHTNDATAFACGRALVAIMENYQNEDMTITIPAALRPYMGGKERI